MGCDSFWYRNILLQKEIWQVSGKYNQTMFHVEMNLPFSINLSLKVFSNTSYKREGLSK